MHLLVHTYGVVLLPNVVTILDLEYIFIMLHVLLVTTVRLAHICVGVWFKGYAHIFSSLSQHSAHMLMCTLKDLLVAVIICTVCTY